MFRWLKNLFRRNALASAPVSCRATGVYEPGDVIRVDDEDDGRLKVAEIAYATGCAVAASFGRDEQGGYLVIDRIKGDD